MSPIVTAWLIVFVFVQQWSTTAQRRRTHIYQALVTLGWCVLGSIVWCYLWFVDSKKNKEYISPRMSATHSPVLSELQSSVSFSALSPGLGPCFIQVAMVNWSVRFWGTTQSGILAAWRPSNLKIRSLSLPLSVTREAVQLVAALGAGRRSVLPEEAPGVIAVETNKRCDRRCVNNSHGRDAVDIGLTLAMITYE